MRTQELCKDDLGAEKCDQMPQILDGDGSFQEQVCSRPHNLLFLDPHSKRISLNSEMGLTFSGYIGNAI